MSATDAIAAVAAVIALAAFVVAFWQGSLTRRHSRLSVTPYLSYETHLAGSQGRIGLTVSNCGIGPARIRHVALFVDDKKVESEEDHGWEDAIDFLGIRELGPNYATFEHGTALPVGSTRWLVYIPTSGEWLQPEPTFEKALARLSLVIEYESFYGETQILDTRRASKK